MNAKVMMLAGAAVVALSATAFELPAGMPDIVFGVISDVHLVKEGDEKTLLGSAACAGMDKVEVPENWAPKKIMGRDFVLGGVFWPGPASNRPDWAMYRLPSLTRTGWFDTVGLNDILWYKPMPEEKKFKALPYTVDAFFGPTNAWHGQRMREGVAAMELLRVAQEETMPIRVDGDCQWGLNILDSTPTPNTYTYLVWLINNKGVTKFEREEAVVDHAFDAKVKITDRRTGKTVEKVVSAGGRGLDGAAAA